MSLERRKIALREMAKYYGTKIDVVEHLEDAIESVQDEIVVLENRVIELQASIDNNIKNKTVINDSYKALRENTPEYDFAVLNTIEKNAIENLQDMIEADERVMKSVKRNIDVKKEFKASGKQILSDVKEISISWGNLDAS